jgi:signal transduction histidine kinase
VRLTQVFGNLINNSCKYTPTGGTIRVSMRRDGDDAIVTVRDTGIGIPSDKLESVFEMFAQVDASLERSQGGLGIGLTLVKRLVNMHGGSVVARSAGPGLGSEFVVRLPVAAAMPAGVEAAEAPRAAPVRRSTC